MVLILLGSIAIPAAAVTGDPVGRRPAGATATRTAAYVSGACVIQLAPGAAAQARLSRVAFPSRVEPGRFVRLGVAGVDQIAAALGGVRFEPEFAGESPPPPGSDEPDFTSFYVVHLAPGTALEAALASFRGARDVATAERIPVLRFSAIPNDSLFTSSYWLYQPGSRRDIHAPEAWDVTKGDTSIVVAVLDTGVLPYHPDLGGPVLGLPGQIWTNWVEANGAPGVDDDLNGFIDDVHGWDCVDLAPADRIDLSPGEDGVDQDNDPNDFDGHGTAVAGALGAITDNVHGIAGVCWNVRIMPVRMGWSTTSGGTLDMVSASRAMRYATRMKASVINASWESDGTAEFIAAVGSAVRAGITIVNAAGNSSPFHYLGDRDDVISVAWTDSNDVVSPFSNTGSWVEIAAPGENLTSTAVIHAGADSISQRQPVYAGDQTGTSMSSPLVAGAAALVQAEWKSHLPLHPLTPRGVELRLLETADDISTQNPTLAGLYGAGRLNMARAVTERTGSTATRTRSRSVGSSVLIPVSGGPSRVAFVTLNRRLMIIDPVSLDTVVNQPLIGDPSSGITAADLGGGHGIGLFVGTFAGTVEGYDANGQPLPNWPQPGSGAMSAGPVLADLDDDGVLEVIAGSDDGFVWVWDADGNVRFSYPVGAPVTGIAAADLDGRGRPSIVAVSAAGDVHAISENGTLFSGAWPVSVGAGPRAPVVMRLGSFTSIVIAGGNQLHALNALGAERPGFPKGLTGPANQDPAGEDVDGDGYDDIVLTEGTALDVRDSTGLSIAGWSHGLAATPTGPPVTGDLIGGVSGPEILVMTTRGLLGYDRSAQPLAAFPKPGGAGQYPSLVQADADGHVEVLAGTGSDSLYYIYDAGAGSSAGTASRWFTDRGNYARTGSTLYAPAMSAIDAIAPVDVADLAAGRIDDTSIQLRWTAPFDAPTGRVASYEVRRSASPITPGNFAAATLVNGAPTPQIAGAPESLTVAGLPEGSSWYFALRSRDAAGNLSPISNVLHAATSSLVPGTTYDLRVTASTDSSITLAWSASGDDGFVGRPRSYAVRADVHAMDSTGYANAPLQRVVSATVDAGGTETLRFLGLAAATHYWFALKAVDTDGNVSLLSNVADAQTDVGGPLGGKRGIALAVLQQPSHGSAELYWQAAAGTEAGTQQILIFDLFGRRLRTLEVGPGAGGHINWDGRDDRGRHVPAGLYGARLLSGSVHIQTRLVLLP